MVVAHSELRADMRRRLALREARLSPSERLRQAELYRADAWKLFQAGLSACGFSRAEIARLWLRPHPRNGAR